MNYFLNLYGDSPKFVAAGHGADIASQRADDLDLLALAYINERKLANIPTFAVDVGCGEGGQSVRMAQAGAKVLATDLLDGRPLLEKSISLGLGERVDFLQCDMRDLGFCGAVDSEAHLVVCQRAIHYLNFSEAVEAVFHMRQLLEPGGHLYISASGISSELGEGYLAAGVPLGQRFAELSPVMREKHGIHAPVCLYSEEDMKVLLVATGFLPRKVFSSPFGNVKAVAVIPCALYPRPSAQAGTAQSQDR